MFFNTIIAALAFSLTTDMKLACESLAPAQVTVSVQGTSSTIHNSVSIHELTALANKTNAPGEHRGIVLGLTRQPLQVNLQPAFRYRDFGNGNVCLRVDVKVTFSGAQQRVDVGREFKKGTCAYKAILAHEFKHVKIHQNALKQLTFNLGRELKKHFENQIYYGKLLELQNQLERNINTMWLPAINKAVEDISSLSASIDTRQEYESVSNACDGEVIAAVKAAIN